MRSKLSGPLLVLGITALTGAGLPGAAAAQVTIGVGIALPPPIVFAAPPQLVLLPGSSVYVAPDFGQDLYYAEGWWWRPWQGRWYRSQYRDRDWGYYESVPSFYGGIPNDWRNRYQSRRWGDRPWNYERMSEDRVRGDRGWSQGSGESDPRRPPSMQGAGPNSSPRSSSPPRGTASRPSGNSRSAPSSSRQVQPPRSSAPRQGAGVQASSPSRKADQPQARSPKAPASGGGKHGGASKDDSGKGHRPGGDSGGKGSPGR
jgi:hypothetical protein